MLAQETLRNAFGKALVELGEHRSDIVVITADVGDATRTKWFKQRFPDRFINIGIAEQNLIDFAAGMSSVGFTPFAVAFAMFLMRAWEQIRNMVCRSYANVKIVGTHAGFSDAGDGSSHQVLEDIALMRVLPCMTIVVPADPLEVKKAAFAIADFPGPVYMRLGRDYSPKIYEEDYEFEIGKSVVLRDGRDIAIIGYGPILWDALKAAKILEEDGISVSVINMHTIKPLDVVTLDKILKSHNGIVVVEEHNVHGGLGAAIAEYVVQTNPIPMELVGTKSYGRSAREVRQLIVASGIDYTAIVAAVKRLLKRLG